ncbi:spermatogenesis- and oogenesis-specific basic helix-loop-helix-containing protein 1-like [Suncus etruscus]|uniref:spermatogenesis- and oogenesis-specific basic helix-loop-helix-containing protein 1-like n=1 Tax=Suncus etruscus TaxID=109475 RepID=UPI0021108651|nr:spermatogenesis- and oogenesis-specific basic helix-loop-helix-containing protein 1-like [Suncus etruscus]
MIRALGDLYRRQDFSRPPLLPPTEPSSSGACTLNSQFFSVAGDSEEFPSCLDTRSLLGGDLEDSTPFLLATSSDCYLGSLEAGGGGIPSCALARSNSLDGAQLGFLLVPEHDAQELQDSALEQWGLDMGARLLAS